MYKFTGMFHVIFKIQIYFEIIFHAIVYFENIKVILQCLFNHHQ